MQVALPLGERKPAYRTTAYRTNALRSADTIRLESEYETRAWCASLGCSSQQLRAAVAAVGPSVDLVQDYLAAEYLLAQ